MSPSNRLAGVNCRATNELNLPIQDPFSCLQCNAMHMYKLGSFILELQVMAQVSFWAKWIDQITEESVFKEGKKCVAKCNSNISNWFRSCAARRNCKAHAARPKPLVADLKLVHDGVTHNATLISPLLVVVWQILTGSQELGAQLHRTIGLWCNFCSRFRFHFSLGLCHKRCTLHWLSN